MWEGGPPTRYRVPEASYVFMALLGCLLTSLFARLSAKLRERLTDEKDCVKIFEWFKDTVAYFADIVPVLTRKPKDIVTLGAFVRPPIPITRSANLSFASAGYTCEAGQGERQTKHIQGVGILRWSGQGLRRSHDPSSRWRPSHKQGLLRVRVQLGHSTAHPPGRSPRV